MSTEQTAPAQQPGHDAKRDKIKGIFSTQVVSKVGTGTTTRKTIQKMYWFAEELDSGEVEMQPLNINYIPSGPKKKVDKEEMLEKFSPEPEFYVSTVFPKMKEMTDTISRADKHRQKGENFSAEYEYKTVLEVDEENVKANFGLGLTYLDRGESDKADDIFQRLVKLDAAFEKEHKHLFNDFGMQLRKNKMCDQSVDYYKRALELSGSDENLHYNMARAWFDKQDMDKTREHLAKALELNPELEAAQQFMDWLKKKGHVT